MKLGELGANERAHEPYVTSPSSARSLRERRAPEITHRVSFMRHNFRERLLVVVLGSGAVAVGCSRLTAPDWSLIPANAAGTSTGATDAGGEAAAGGETGGTPALGGTAGEASGGEAGAAGGGAEPAGGSAGTSGSGGRAGSGNGGGGAGNAGGGLGGVAGSGGSSGSGGMAGTTGSAGAPPCTGTPGSLDNTLVLFAGPAAASGARGGRTSMDAACEAERVKLGLTQTTTHAFITVAVNDFIGQWGGPNQYYQNLPMNRRVVGPTGIQLATTFGDLIDGTIEQSLVCAKVVPASTLYWLTGNATTCAQPIAGGPFFCGQFSSAEETCSGWTLGTYDPIIQARYGSTTLADNRWLTVATTLLNLRESCDVATDPILCLAYTP